ncbi:MAG: T9SS type A sorting domain-containing protein, partial [Gemmatimonadetes bacterium]|nr:T9SS type A sorting domain-containing protein [Gemmatimonadota bacterium]
RAGTNTSFTYARTVHHGIEVMWPGIALRVQYADLLQPVLPVADLPVFADELAAGWRLDRREQTSVETTAGQAFAGALALQVTPAPGFIFYLDMTAVPPVSVKGYGSLHLAIHPQGVELNGLPGFSLSVNEKSVDLQGEIYHIDLENRQWQEIEIPLAELGLRFDYIETIRLAGRLQGTLLLDDVRLVTEAPSTAVAEQGGRARPAVFALLPNYPNPFNNGTTLHFVLPEAGMAELNIYNLLGQKVAGVLHEFLPAGSHSRPWDGHDDDGQDLATGVYLCRLRSAGHTEVRNLVLLR